MDNRQNFLGMLQHNFWFFLKREKEYEVGRRRGKDLGGVGGGGGV